LTKGDREDLVAQRANHQIAREQRQDGEQLGLSRQALSRCTRCREPGHNSRTCQISYINKYITPQKVVALLPAEIRKLSGVAHSLVWPARLSTTLLKIQEADVVIKAS
jgi:hypothetical protein